MNENRVLVTSEEEQNISRTMMIWLNSYPDLPDTITRVDYEQLPADKPGMSLSVQGAYITRRYICGGHVAEYQFSVLYRIKPGNSNDARLKADEALDALGDWAEQHWPNLGEDIAVRDLSITARSTLLVPYENGDEDHQIIMKLIYEVI